MITFFSIPRAFTGEFNKLQRTAIASWKSIGGESNVVLFGDGQGVADTCSEMILWNAVVETNDYGTPLFNSAFNRAEKYASHGSWMCEVSADIILGGNFRHIIILAEEFEKPFIIGQRWDIDPGAAPETAKLHSPAGIDYFLYKRGTLGEIPPFAVGMTAYDNWMVWAAINLWGMTVIDATGIIEAIHVNHSYPGFPDGRADIQVSAERQENVRLAKETGCNRWCGINDAPYFYLDGKIVKRGNDD